MSFTSLEVARTAAVVSACAVLVSPPLTNLALFVTLIAFLSSPEARRHFLAVLRQPLGLAALVLLASLIVGATYGAGTVRDRLDELLKGRAWLFLPIFAALFAEERAKRRLAITFVLFCGVAALLSFVFWMVDYSPGRRPFGILFRDYVMQGMSFSLAAFIGLLLLLRQKAELSQRIQALLLVSAILAFLNVILVSIGRSGHVALATLTLFLLFILARYRGQRKIALLVGVIVLAGFMSSTMIRERFSLAFKEAATVGAQADGTSIGFRLVFWKNTADLIRERPFFGHGTGGFAPAYAAKVSGIEGWKGGATTDPHNQYLLTLAERGVVGLIALAAFLVILARQKGSGSPWREIGFGAILAWCLTNIVNSHFHAFDQAHLFVMIVGAFLAPLASFGTEPRNFGAASRRGDHGNGDGVVQGKQG